VKSRTAVATDIAHGSEGDSDLAALSTDVVGSSSGDRTNGFAATPVVATSAEVASPSVDPLRNVPRRWPVITLTSLLVALSLAWGAWLISGGGLFWVGSPSMGVVAPVGSLVATQPLPSTAKLHTGEIVVFDPHPGLSVTYVHRIYKAIPGGRYLTKGDLNAAPDPWVITRDDIIGTPRAIIPVIGWIYKCATWLFLGAAALVFVALFVGQRQRRWILALGPPVLVAVPLLKFRPVIGGFVYGSGQRGRLVTVNVVDTGILPVRYLPANGSAVRAVPGQEVLVSGLASRHSSELSIRIEAALPWWGWALVVVLCLVPLAMVMIRSRRTPAGGGSARESAGLEAEQLPLGDASPPSFRSFLSDSLAILDEFYLTTLLHSSNGPVGIDEYVTDRADVWAPGPIFHHT
jgi:hypothetical protein